MNVRKLLDWRKALIYAHRWMGIVGALVFVAWFISGIVFAFRNMPTFTTAERLSHLAPIDLSTARVEPMDAARNLGIQPTRLRVGMYYDGRPLYRFQGTSIITPIPEKKFQVGTPTRRWTSFAGSNPIMPPPSGTTA